MIPLCISVLLSEWDETKTLAKYRIVKLMECD